MIKLTKRHGVKSKALTPIFTLVLIGFYFFYDSGHSRSLAKAVFIDDCKSEMIRHFEGHDIKFSYVDIEWACSVVFTKEEAFR